MTIEKDKDQNPDEEFVNISKLTLLDIDPLDKEAVQARVIASMREMVYQCYKDSSLSATAVPATTIAEDQTAQSVQVISPI